MTRRAARPLLVGKVQLRWYAIAILPILAAVWFGFTGVLAPYLGLVGLFAFFFWLTSLVFAIANRLSKRSGSPRA
jgi:hypothetical protein